MWYWYEVRTTNVILIVYNQQSCQHGVKRSMDTTYQKKKFFFSFVIKYDQTVCTDQTKQKLKSTK